MTTSDKIKRARERWLGINANLKGRERNILALMRHKDTTHAQLVATHETYKQCHADIVQMQAELEKKFPARAVLIGRGRMERRSLWDRDLL